MTHNSLIRHEQTLDPAITHDVLTGLDVPKQPTVRSEYPTDIRTKQLGLSECLFLSVMQLLVITTTNSRMPAGMYNDNIGTTNKSYLSYFIFRKKNRVCNFLLVADRVFYVRQKDKLLYFRTVRFTTKMGAFYDPQYVKNFNDCIVFEAQTKYLKQTCRINTPVSGCPSGSCLRITKFLPVKRTTKRLHQLCSQTRPS